MAGALAGEEAFDGVADQRFHVRDDGCERMPIIGVAGQRFHMGDELAALGVRGGCGDGDLDPELVGPVRLALDKEEDRYLFLLQPVHVSHRVR